MDFFEIISNFGNQTVPDTALLILRIVTALLAVIIIYNCYNCLRKHRREETPLIMLVNKKDGDCIPVLCWENSVGRAKGCDITLPDPAVSREHAVLLRRDKGWYISDTGSKSGTYVNGRRADGRKAVYIDDDITVGGTTLQVKRASEFTDINKPSWFFKKETARKGMTNFSLMMLVSVFLLFLAAQACAWLDGPNLQPMIIYVLFMAVMWGFYFFTTKILKRTGFELETIALFLSGLGVMISCRQNMNQTYVQMAAVVLGIILFCIMIKFLENPDRANRWRPYVMVGSVLIMAVNIVFGSIRGGAAAWIEIGPITIQPSEFVKVAFIFVGAGALDYLQTKRNFIEFIIFSALCVGSLFIISDFGTALIFFFTFIVISIVRSGDYKTAILAVISAVLGSALILKYRAYIAKRFEAWGNVWEFADTTGYQQVRVLTYAASGGLIGVGIGNGYLKYVAASESDLVFGLVCEELGLIVALCVAVAIAGLAFYARAITTRSRSTFYSISAVCAATLLIFQSCLNVFGATDLLPLTGVTLPFVSLGGSSMVSCWGLLAFIKAADERTYSAARSIKR